MSELASHVDGWRPAQQVDTDPLTATSANALANVLDTSDALVAGDALPALWHWVYFQEWPAQHVLGPDGHPADGRFLPPIPDRRRMFAGGRLRVHRPLLLGQPAERSLSLVNATPKTGQSGELLFVTVRGEFRQGDALCLVEEQDLVYRSGDSTAKRPSPERPTGTPASTEPWQREFIGDPVRLFRFSALTANSHRIHYDAPYAREVEMYPDLVVHGPLLAILMGQLLRDNRVPPVSTVEYRFRNPVFAGDPVLVSGSPRPEGKTQLQVRSAPDILMAEMTTTS